MDSSSLLNQIKVSNQPNLLTDSQLIMVHNAIHHNKVLKMADGSVAQAHIGARGLRCMTLNNILFIEQNPNKDTKYAKRAREGHKLTWGIREGEWILIEDGKVIKR